VEQLTKAFQGQVRRDALVIRTDAYLSAQMPGQKNVEIIPLIWVDASKKPDVAQLWRTHEQYGEGDQEVRWLYLMETAEPEKTAFFLDIQVRIPGRRLVRYFVAFPVTQHEELLERMVTASQFGIMTEPWPTWKEHQDDQGMLKMTPELLTLLRRGTMYESPDRSELEKMLVHWRTFVKRTT